MPGHVMVQPGASAGVESRYHPSFSGFRGRGHVHARRQYGYARRLPLVIQYF